jgi:hypothetical protein
MTTDQILRANDLLIRLSIGIAGSCSCGTDTPLMLRHQGTCRYRLLCEAYTDLREMKVELERLRRTAGEPTT